MYATVIDQRKYAAKDGLDLSPAPFAELFNGAVTGRFCQNGCEGDQNGWLVTWKPAADPALCTSKWNGVCSTGNTGNYC